MNEELQDKHKGKYIPYSGKIWQGFKFGDLGVNCQIKSSPILSLACNQPATWVRLVSQFITCVRMHIPFNRSWLSLLAKCMPLSLRYISILLGKMDMWCLLYTHGNSALSKREVDKANKCIVYCAATCMLCGFVIGFSDMTSSNTEFSMRSEVYCWLHMINWVIL